MNRLTIALGCVAILGGALTAAFRPEPAPWPFGLDACHLTLTEYDQRVTAWGAAVNAWSPDFLGPDIDNLNDATYRACDFRITNAPCNADEVCMVSFNADELDRNMRLVGATG